MTSKERSALAAQAQKIEPIFQIGKGGIDASVIAAVDEALTARELIKLSVLKTSEKDTQTVLNELAAALHAEPIACIGFKIVLYRFSEKCEKERKKKNK